MSNKPNTDKHKSPRAPAWETGPVQILLCGLCALLPITPITLTSAQETERWFQIEVSVFSNELASDRNEEFWSAERTTLTYPERVGRLQTLFELLLIPSLIAPQEDELDAGGPMETEDLTASEPSAQEIRQQIIAETGPFPPDGGDTYRFPDFDRDAFVQLPNSESEFQQTNRALERSAEHRLLFHGLWRQPMPDPGNETPIIVNGGDRFGDHFELEGSLSLHFNSGRDRVVIDADLWLAEFTRLQQDSEWQLPESPLPSPSFLTRDTGSELDAPPYSISRVYHMAQSRDMRSTEFHYLDHPAIGIVVTVFPYEVPPLSEPESATDF